MYITFSRNEMKSIKIVFFLRNKHTRKRRGKEILTQKHI